MFNGSRHLRARVHQWRLAGLPLSPAEHLRRSRARGDAFHLAAFNRFGPLYEQAMTPDMLAWDGAAERFTNSAKANELLHYKYRAPYKLT